MIFPQAAKEKSVFKENRTENGLVYLSSSVIPAFHAFSTRYGGVSKNGFETMNLGSNRGDDREDVRENYTRWCALFGAGRDDCCVTNQVHGKKIDIVTEKDRHVCLSPRTGEADGLVTGEKNLPIFCFTADCVPVILCDRQERAAGAVHCGWKSSVQDILKEAVTAMETFGAAPEEICAALGPAIGRCCFETDKDVPDAITAYLGGDTEGIWTIREDGKYLVDLRKANARRLMQLGLREENIDISEECTFCSHEKFWSARYTGRHGQVRGNLAAGIVLR